MVNIRRPLASELAPFWREMRRLWRQDSIRRQNLGQLEEVRRWLILDQVQLWLAWDDEPVDRGEFGGPHYCVGIAVSWLLSPDTLSVQFACGRSVQKWMPAMALEIEAFARAKGCTQLEIFCRKGWKQELGSLWTFPPEAVTFHRDPELYAYAERTPVSA